MKFPKEFIEAVKQLPTERKDKLLLRLLKHDLPLSNKLNHEFFNTDSLDEQQQVIRDLIDRFWHADRYNFHPTPGYLMFEIREISGHINEHVRLNKDKFGEVSLNLYMFNTVLSHTEVLNEGFTAGECRKLAIYMITRTVKILVLMQKLHEDYQLDLEDDFKTLGAHIENNVHLKRVAKQHALDTKWLTEFEVPEDMASYQKALKAQGYLSGKVYLRTPDFIWR